MFDVQLQVTVVLREDFSDADPPAIQALKLELAKRYPVEISSIRRTPRLLPWDESVAIFIAGGVATTLISSVVSDLYSTAKKWAKERIKGRKDNKLTTGCVRVIISYETESKREIVEWCIFDDDERELKSLLDRISPSQDPPSRDPLLCQLELDSRMVMAWHGYPTAAARFWPDRSAQRCPTLRNVEQWSGRS